METNELSIYQTDEGWLDVEKILSEIKKFGFLIGNRSIGKTYGFLNYSVNEALKSFFEKYEIQDINDFNDLPDEMESDWQFFFLRRYITQSKAAAKRLLLQDFYQNLIDELNDIDSGILENYDLSYTYLGSASEVRDICFLFKNKRDKKIRKYLKIGYISQVSTAEKIRGPGIPQIKLIIFDEFQAKKGWDYISNEPVELQDIYDSITRNRTDCKLVALGNAGTILNPYFDYYDYDEFDSLKTEKNNGTIVFYHLDIKAMRDKEYNDLISGTDYENYAARNSYADMQEFNLLRLKDAKEPRNIMYNVSFLDKTYGVWKDGDGKTIISRIIDPEKKVRVDRFPNGNEILDIETHLVLSGLLKNKLVYFDSPEVRLITEKHLRKYIFKKQSGWDSF